MTTTTQTTSLELAAYADGVATFEAGDQVRTLAGPPAARIAQLELDRATWDKLGRPTTVTVAFAVEVAP